MRCPNCTEELKKEQINLYYSCKNCEESFMIMNESDLEFVSSIITKNMDANLWDFSSIMKNYISKDLGM